MPALQKFVAFKFYVNGVGRFPVDMLRYDSCVPYGQTDVYVAFTQTDGRRVQMMAFAGVGCRLEPTSARWESFGWTVEVGSVQACRA